MRTEKNHNVWTVCKPIGITLLKHTNANIDQIQTSASKDLTSVRQEDYGIKGKKDQRFNKVSASVEISIQDDFNSKHDNGEHINSNFDTAQYLKPGRDGESFFYEGSETDKTGASFKVEYENCSMKGQYDLIIDINNLRTISSGFRREVIKMISDGTTLRAASSFITVEKGNAHFSKDDGVWLVDKPLIIKLIK